MSKFIHILLQVAGVTVSVGTVAANVVPVQYKALVVAIVSAIQAALAVYNHKS